MVHSLESLPRITLWAAAAEPHPPLHYYVLHLWMLAAGSSEFAVRYPSVVFGVLTIPLVYRLVRGLAGPRRAAIASLAIGLSAFHVYYSQEARMHVEACFFMVAAAWALVEAIKRPSASRWVAYGLAAVAGLYTFYFCALALAAINLPILFNRQRRSRGWWLANGAALAALAPWLVLVAIRTSRFVGEPRPGGLPGNPLASFGQAVVGYAFGVTADIRLSLLPGALLLALLLACAWRLIRRHGSIDQMLPLWAFLPPIGIYLTTFVAAGAADMAPRLVLICLPAWIAVVARGCPKLPRLAWAPAVLVLGLPTAAALAANYDNPMGRDNYRAISTLLGRQALPDEAVIYDTPDQLSALQYYPVEPALAAFGLPASASQAQTNATLTQLAGQYHGFWAVLYGEPNPWVEDWLDAHLPVASNQWFGPYVRLKHYLAAPLPAGTLLTDSLPVDAAFGPFRVPRVKLAGATSSGEIRLEIEWQVVSPVAADYQRSIQLFDEFGRRLAQVDGPPLGGAIPTSHWLPERGYVEPVVLQPTVPLHSGMYEVRASVYGPGGELGSQRAMLRVAHLEKPHIAALGVASSAGWTIESLAVGTDPDGELLVQVTGSVQSTPPASYTWFLHLVDRQGNLVAQDDHPSLAATTAWRPGDRVAEVFRLPPGSREGTTLELGAYDGSGQRARFLAADGRSIDHVVVPV